MFLSENSLSMANSLKCVDTLPIASASPSYNSISDSLRPYTTASGLDSSDSHRQKIKDLRVSQEDLLFRELF
jgi:hypothetical protein